MSIESNPVEIVAGIYAAFGRQDIPAILAHMHPEVQWEYGVSPPDVPWLEHRQGVGGVGAFFEALGAVDFERFEVKRIVGEGDLVVGVVDVEFVHRKTARRVVEVDEVHLWTLDGQGRVTRFRHRCDTLQHWAACSGSEIGESLAIH